MSVASFTVAVNNRKADGEATFFRCSAWRGTAENCVRYLDKGRKVAVVGEVSARGYTTKAGETKASLEVNVNEIEFLTPAQPQNFTPVESAEPVFEEPGKDLPF